jgi:hypothetical protein
MKIQGVAYNNHRREFSVRAGRRTYCFPYACAEAPPATGDSVVSVAVDPELGREAFAYTTASGRSGAVHVEQVLDHNRDPRYLREALLYELTLAARRGVASSLRGRRELARRMGTSPAQLYRLLDPTDSRKSVDQLLVLLSVLDCDVQMQVRAGNVRRKAAPSAAPA